jgi:hypothetical protein
MKSCKVLSTIGLLLLITWTFTADVNAQAKIESPRYEIQFPNFNSGAGVPESANYTINTTIGKINGVFASGGFVIKAGFQYISTIIPFSFSISKTAINFGTLYRDTPKTDYADIVIKAGGAGGYSLKTFEDHPLQDIKNGMVKATIIDTLCDTTCSESTAANWTTSTKYGFGFNLWGDDKATDFTSQDDYRQFADKSTGENPTPIMLKSHVTYDYPNNAWPWESLARITFKVNIGPLQPMGTYQNFITFVAIPSF